MAEYDVRAAAAILRTNRPLSAEFREQTAEELLRLRAEVERLERERDDMKAALEFLSDESWRDKTVTGYAHAALNKAMDGEDG